MSSPLDVAPPFGGATCFPCTPAQLVENIYGKASAADFKGLKSAVRVVCRLLNKDPNTWVLNSAKDLVDAVHSVHPIRANVTPSYWTTTSSRVMAVLRRNGVEFLSGRCNTELPPEWARLIVAARLLDAARTRSLLPFFRDRFAIGRLPSDIAQLDFEEYCWRVDQLSNRKNKLAGKQAVQRDWNFFVSRIDGWPQVPFSFHNKRKDYLLPEHEMPPAVAEFDAKKRMPLRCQSASNFDPLSACNIDPLGAQSLSRPRPELRSESGAAEGLAGGARQERFLSRQLSLPVSTISQ